MMFRFWEHLQRKRTVSLKKKKEIKIYLLPCPAKEICWSSIQGSCTCLQVCASIYSCTENLICDHWTAWFTRAHLQYGEFFTLLICGNRIGVFVLQNLICFQYFFLWRVIFAMHKVGCFFLYMFKVSIKYPTKQIGR